MSMPTSAGGRRVLFVSHMLNLSGVSRHMMLLANGLKARGWGVGVGARELHPGTPMGREWFEAAGVRTFQAPFPLYGLTVRNAASAARSIGALQRIVRDFTPDLLHVHAPTLCPYAALVGWMNDIPTVSTLHLESLGPNKVRLARLGNRVFSKAFGDYSIAISTDMSRLLTDALELEPARVRVVFHGVDDARFRPPSDQERIAAREAYRIARDAHVVCLIGVIEERKGHAVLIGALAELRRRGMDVIALCAGEGSTEARERVERQAQTAGVADLVRLLGHRDSREVIWASDACVLPSLQEGFALVIVESMLCGVVPLRTPAAGTSDQMIDGQNGFVIPFNDHQTLADRLELLFSRPELRARMGRAAHDFARARFTAGLMTESTVRVYEDAIRELRRTT